MTLFIAQKKREQIREVLKDYIVDFYKRETAIDRIILLLEES